MSLHFADPLVCCAHRSKNVPLAGEKIDHNSQNNANILFLLKPLRSTTVACYLFMLGINFFEWSLFECTFFVVCLLIYCWYLS